MSNDMGRMAMFEKQAEERLMKPYTEADMANAKSRLLRLTGKMHKAYAVVVAANTAYAIAKEEYEEANKAFVNISRDYYTNLNEKAVKCCCQWGSALGKRGGPASAAEYPEFGCAQCPVHQAALGETELCKRHATMKG